MDINNRRRKAEDGSCVHQSILGLSYLYGIDVEIDYKEAFRWLSAAAAQGASRAVLNLGRMYLGGLGISKNIPEAIRLFEIVARRSDGSDAFEARIELGRTYSRGLGVPVDAAIASEWYSAAITLAAGNADSEEIQEANAYLASV